MSFKNAKLFTPGSELSQQANLEVNWPSPDTLVHDDREYLVRKRLQFEWGVNQEPFKALIAIGLGRTVVSFESLENEEPEDSNGSNKTGIIVPSSIINRDHWDAVRTVIVGADTGHTDPPHLEVLINTHIISAKANVESWKLKSKNMEEPFAHAAFGITNAFVEQQLLRATYMLEVMAFFNHANQKLPEGIKHNDHRTAAAKLVGSFTLGSLQTFEASFRDEQLSTYLHKVTSRPNAYSSARKTIRSKALFAPASVILSEAA